MNVDITEGHFVLLAALLYNERGIAATEDEIRSNIRKAAETVQTIPTQKFITKESNDQVLQNSIFKKVKTAHITHNINIVS